MPTYRVKVRYENELGIKAVVGEVETGPGASVLGAQFLAVHLDQDTRDALSDMAKRAAFNSTIPHGPVLNIAIHRIYSIEQLDEIPDPPQQYHPDPKTGIVTVPAEEPKQGKLSADGTHRAWSGSDPQPMEPINTVWDKDGHRWEHQEGMNLWESDAHQYPEPWAELLSYFGPVTDRLVV
ncbi:hypothetical protein [Rhodococcoides fascians]|uniref:hypothetical protein n=1 Tax=Rhodococcoides fascians TaxID=1828 RepID=UPI000A602B98|nr:MULTISPECIES: hypothetical protein [Rhodococcus]